jgi:hypothetical protein
LGADKHKPKVQGRDYVITKQDTQASPSVIKGTLLIAQSVAQILIDLGTSYSFISPNFTHHLKVEPEPLEYFLIVATGIH